MNSSQPQKDRYINSNALQTQRSSIIEPVSITYLLSYRSCILFVMGIILVAPFMWIQFDDRMGVPTLIRPANGETMKNGDKRMLLGSHSTEFDDADRPCEGPESSKSVGEGGLPRLETIHEWMSNKTYSSESLTLLTQLSADRLSMLENQCRTWSDYIIAVVYIPLIRSKYKNSKPEVYGDLGNLDDVIRGVSAFHSFMEGSASCGLRINLVGQYIKDDKSNPYPINALRNIAMSLARTDLVLVLDVDFVASPLLGLPEPGYKDPEVYKQMLELTSMKKALVIPAFELTNRHQDLALGQNYARNMVISGKNEVRKGYKAGTLDAFNAHDAPWGHGPTNTSKWARMSTPVLYKVEYQPKYEPFIVLSRSLAPWCDERFVGYGGNKISYINHLKGLGYGFYVHPYGYAIHVPHSRTRAADRFVAHKKSGQAEMENLRAEIEKEIDSGTYIPVTANCKARHQLSSKSKTPKVS
eukprot:jgi/Picsp_1/2150/NSC_05615-R1_glycosyltransferase-like protein large1